MNKPFETIKETLKNICNHVSGAQGKIVDQDALKNLTQVTDHVFTMTDSPAVTAPLSGQDLLKAQQIINLLQSNVSSERILRKHVQEIDHVPTLYRDIIGPAINKIYKSALLTRSAHKQIIETAKTYSPMAKEAFEAFNDLTRRMHSPGYDNLTAYYLATARRFEENGANVIFDFSNYPPRP